MNDVSRLVRAFVPGERVFMPGSAGEVPALTAALADGPPLDITASFVTGINKLPLAHLPEGSHWNGLFAQPSTTGAHGRGIFRQSVHSYGGYALALARGPGFDTCIVQVAPPDQNGNCSLGVAVEFTPIAVRKSRRVLAVINPRMPHIAGAASLPYRDFAVVAEIDAPLREYQVGAPSALATRIAKRIATYIEDGAALQIGLGKVPDALLRLLTDRRRLRLHSGMLSDGAQLLAESGSLDPNFAHTSCVHVGTQSYYDWLAGRTDFAVRGCDQTHAPATLAGMSGLIAVNSALSVDLFGQANLEMLDGRAISSVGGAADFARAASFSADGISIIALPATSGSSDLPRIVPRLDGICSLPRQDVDVVITEHGAADLRGLSVFERGTALIAVAAPQHRPALDAAFSDIIRIL